MNFDILSSLDYDFNPTDSIVDAPSFVTPILIKKEPLKEKTRLQQQLLQSLSSSSNSNSRSSLNCQENKQTSDTIISTNDINQNSGILDSDRDQIGDFETSDKNNVPSNQNRAHTDDDDDDDIQIIKIITRNSIGENSNANPQEPTIKNTTDPIDPVYQAQREAYQKNRRRMEDYIRETTIASLTKYTKLNTDKQILAVEDYFKSSPGHLLMGIGLSRVVEFNLENESKRLSRKVKASHGDCKAISETLEQINGKLISVLSSNKPFKGNDIYTCPHCPYKSDLEVVMNGHLERPHKSGKFFLCNWCNYRVRDPDMIIHHCFVEHKQRCYLDGPISNHMCSFCPYEAKSKRQLQSHQLVCQQNFTIDASLSPGEDDILHPAITTKFISKVEIAAFERIIHDIRLATYNPNIMKVPGSHQSANGYQPILVVPGKNLPANKYPAQNRLTSFNPLDRSTSLEPVTIQSNTNANTSTIRPNIVTNGNFSNPSRLMALLAERNIPTNTSSTSISILQFPNNLPTSFTNGRLGVETVPSVLMRHTTPSNSKKPRKDNGTPTTHDANLPTTNPKSSSFVICEICDWYIKDIDQLKSHMQLYHKVKLHQRTLHSRPPLNCQKCQWRFFTDQGLERHLLGAHGLVTSNMQELVEEDNDSGRCTVCGRAFANKLVAHMKDVHKLNLKPAHLSYKCTVCAATFNLYRLFENHVYTVHSDSLRHGDSSTSAARS